MLRTLDDNSGAQNRSEEVEFCCTKALASGSCRADRAVVLRQEEGALPKGFNLGHVSFLGSDARQFPNLFLEWKRAPDSRRIIRPLSRVAGLQDAFQARLAKGVSHGLDQGEAHLRISVREEPIRLASQLPILAGLPSGTGLSSAVTSFSRCNW